MQQLILSLFLFIAFTSAKAQDSKTDTVTIDSKTFTQVEVEAGFPGGDEAWKKFLIKHLNTNVPAKNNAPAGRYTVIVKFIVNKTGSISEAKAETNNGYGMEEEVIRVIEKSGKWTPAMQNGRTVNAYRRQPITFATETEAFELKTGTPYTFYTGVENELSVTVPKLKAGNIDVTISKGTIKQVAEGKYMVKVTQPGRVIIEVFNTKKDKSLGTASFEVVAKK